MSSKSKDSIPSPTWYYTKHQDRKNFILEFSYGPILVCVLAFARSAWYRLTVTPEQCHSFGWFSSSSGEFQCDHKPLDWHASFALGWLATFSLQVLFLSTNTNTLHKVFGKFLGLIIAFGNASGMLYFAVYDYLYPMEKTDRPADFTPFMFLVACKYSICLGLATKTILSKDRDVEKHMLWMYRAFITSFTTPVIRFYPAVLRHLAGTDCFQEHREKFVMGAMFVSEIVCVVLYTLVQLRTQTKFWDTFMKLQVLTLGFATLKELQFASIHGAFLTGMVECVTTKYGIRSNVTTEL
jgi:hypothetical protein